MEVGFVNVPLRLVVEMTALENQVKRFSVKCNRVLVRSGLRDLLMHGLLYAYSLLD